MKENPCYGCEDRQVGCHGVCERYAAWKAEHEAEKDERYRRERPEIMTTTYKVDTAIKNNKRRRKGR